MSEVSLERNQAMEAFKNLDDVVSKKKEMESYVEHLETTKNIVEKAGSSMTFSKKQMVFLKLFQVMVKAETIDVTKVKTKRKVKKVKLPKDVMSINPLSNIKITKVELLDLNKLLSKVIKEQAEFLVSSHIMQKGGAYRISPLGKKLFGKNSKQEMSKSPLAKVFVLKEGTKKEGFKIFLQDPKKMNPEVFPFVEAVQYLIGLDIEEVGNFGTYLTLFHYIYHLHVKKGAGIGINMSDKFSKAIEAQFLVWATKEAIPVKAPREVASFEVEFPVKEMYGKQPSPAADYPDFRAVLPDF